MNILDALRAINEEAIQGQRVALKDGMLSISDAVFTDSLRRLGVSEETIEWRLLEDVKTRGDVIEMYGREEIKR